MSEKPETIGVTDASMKQWQKCFKILDAAEQAYNAGNIAVAANHFLTAAILCPVKDCLWRYRQLHLFEMISRHTKFVMTEQLQSMIDQAFVYTTDYEPPHYRAHTAYLLAIHFSKLEQSPAAWSKAVKYCQLTITFCNQATAQERQQKVIRAEPPNPHILMYSWKTRNVCKESDRKEKLHKLTQPSNPEGDEYTVGEILDSLRKNASMHLQNIVIDELGYTDPAKLKAEGGAKFLQAILLSADVLVRQPPATTSSVIQQIKKLTAAKDTTLLIRSDRTTVIQQGNNGEAREVFRAFKVNMKRFRSGKTTKIFSQYQILLCDPKETRQRKLLSTFIGSCLEPNVLFPGLLPKHEPWRPYELLFQSEQDLQLPQVREFLKMMDCTELKVADAALLSLLEETFEAVQMESVRDTFLDCPLLSDLAHDIACGYCSVVGCELKQCPCGKAYYCGKECQDAHWKAHISEHKAALSLASSKSAKPAAVAATR